MTFRSFTIALSRLLKTAHAHTQDFIKYFFESSMDSRKSVAKKLKMGY